MIQNVILNSNADSLVSDGKAYILASRGSPFVVTLYTKKQAPNCSSTRCAV
jgi:hypothetical protein